MWSEFELIGFENSNRGQCRTGLRATRLNKSVFSLRGTFQIDRDYNNDFDVNIDTNWSLLSYVNHKNDVSVVA